MKFCMITTFFGEQSFGGDSVYVERLSKALLRRGHEVDVIHCSGAFQILRGSQPPRSYQPPAGLRIHTLGQSPLEKFNVIWSHQTGRMGGRGEFFRHFLEKNRFDAIHLHNLSLLGAYQLLQWLGYWKPATLLVTLHDYWWVCPLSLLWKNGREVCRQPGCLPCQLRAGRPIQWWRRGEWFNQALAAADALIFPSQEARTIHLQRNLRHERMEIIPSFLPGAWFSSESNLPTSSAGHLPFPYFAAAGRLVPEKGFQDLIKAARGFPDYEFHIAGGGPAESSLRRQAHGNPRIHLKGILPAHHVIKLFTGARAVVVPSLFPETFCFVAAEALALGVPIVARRRGALQELVQESGGGILFETVEEMQQALHRVAQDDHLRLELGIRGRDAAARLWSEELHLNRYLALLKDLKQR
jgi:glycosyltransferase involved in cell wall biosynthesis